MYGHRQPVEFMEWREERIPFERSEAFSFRKDRPYHWLQKLCLWALKKIGAYDFGETVECTRHTIDADSFMERIFQQKENLYGFFNQEPDTILVGAEDFQEITGGEEVRKYLSFHTEYSKGPMVLGLTVKVVPWMKGIVVMPKGVIE